MTRIITHPASPSGGGYLLDQAVRTVLVGGVRKIALYEPGNNDTCCIKYGRNCASGLVDAGSPIRKLPDIDYAKRYDVGAGRYYYLESDPSYPLPCIASEGTATDDECEPRTDCCQHYGILITGATGTNAIFNGYYGGDLSVGGYGPDGSDLAFVSVSFTEYACSRVQFVDNRDPASEDSPGEGSYYSPIFADADPPYDETNPCPRCGGSTPPANIDATAGNPYTIRDFGSPHDMTMGQATVVCLDEDEEI